MDLARAPRRTARKKGSGYENGSTPYSVPIPPVAFTCAANTSEYDIFCFVLPENLLILTNFLLLLVRKSGEGIKELICAYLNSFGKITGFVMVIIHPLGSL